MANTSRTAQTAALGAEVKLDAAKHVVSATGLR
jgi:hypothetical protein